MVNRCPSKEVLSDLALGRLPAEAIESLGGHVEGCSLCQEVLESFDHLEDSLVQDLRATPSPGSSDFSPDLERQLQAAEGISQVARATPFSPEAEPLPRQIGQYELLEHIGQGGMGIVYKARHTKLKRVVAVKVLPPHRLPDGLAVERFHREMEAVAGLDHPHIGRAVDANEVDGQHFLVMEFVDGVNLAQLVRQVGPLAVADACEVARQAALALDHAHGRGLVHRDLKPSNLMLAVDGTVKLLDFGLARLRPEGLEGSALTDTGQLLGTADFMAPEQGLDARNADARSDLYSLGCTLYFLLTGQPPFAGPAYATAMQKLMAHAQAPVPSASRSRPDVPLAVDEVLDRLLAKGPWDRFPTAGDVVAALGPLASTPGLTELCRKAIGQHSFPPASLATPPNAMKLPPPLAPATQATQQTGTWTRANPMNRRAFLTGAALGGGVLLAGGVLWGRAAYARSQLTRRLIADAMPTLTTKAHAELGQLPAKGRDEIRTWFHGPCLNSAEFVYEVCSHAFAERLAACPTEGLKELCFLNAFVGRVVSEVEILNRVEVIAEEIGGEIDRNWAACCAEISAKWDVHLQPYGAAMPSDFTTRVEPLVRKSLQEAIQRAAVAGQKPAIGETVENIGKSALLVMPLIVMPKASIVMGASAVVAVQTTTWLPQVAIPLFVLLALRHLYAFVMGPINNQVGDYQRAISERLALLGNRIGSEFESEVKARVAALHAWQEGALRHAAETRAQDTVSII